MSACRPNRRNLEAVIAHMRSEARRHRREIQHLRVENKILREAAQPLIHHAPARDRFAFNGRPRKTLGWKTPAEALNEQLLSISDTGVATID